MNIKEKALWQMMKDWSKKHLSITKGYNVHLQRIESEMTSEGISDLNGCLNSKEAWIELKVFTGKSIGLRPKQINWIKNRIKAGGNCWILARKPDSTFDQLYLWHGSKIQELSDRGAEVEPNIRLVRTAQNKPFMWQYIFNCIFSCSWPEANKQIDFTELVKQASNGEVFFGNILDVTKL